jgi:hypothetical protein
MMSRADRVLLVSAPIAAVAAVAVGLELGGHGGVRAAVVTAAPSGGRGAGLAWQVAVFEEERGLRQAIADGHLEVVATRGETQARWSGTTNAEGVAEMQLALPGIDGVHLLVRSEGALLAEGDAAAPPDLERPAPPSPWLRFARREGPIVLDVAALGERVAPGFPAHIWVRTTEAKTGAPLSGVDVAVGDDASAASPVPGARTDSRGWAELSLTPVGLAVGLTLDARRDALRGSWIGGLFMSPGGSSLDTRSRWGPEESIEIQVQSPIPRPTAYLEIDDVHGRVWAVSLPLAPPRGAMPSAVARPPRLAPGLYWAVTSDDPASAAGLGAGTMVRPFFVAQDDEGALGFGSDPTACAPPRDSRDNSRAVASCLALASATPARRWTAIDGFSMQHAHNGNRRARGLAVALSALFVALLLDAAILLRAALSRRARLALDASDPEAALAMGAGRGLGAAVALLVALLGFVLLAAFLVRLA